MLALWQLQAGSDHRRQVQWTSQALPAADALSKLSKQAAVHSGHASTAGSRPAICTSAHDHEDDEGKVAGG